MIRPLSDRLRVELRVGEMMRWLVLALASFMVLLGNAVAAPIAVANSDFEGDYDLVNNGRQGTHASGAAGWTHNGTAGTFDPDDSLDGDVYATSSELYGRTGYLNAGSTLYQLLGVSIAADTDYALSALFGHRFDHDFGGVFGFFAGDPGNIIGSATIADPGLGQWSLQSFTLESALITDYVGQALGVIFLGATTQVNIDNVFVESRYVGDEKVLVTPAPGALPLMLAGIVGGWIASRRRKKNAV